MDESSKTVLLLVFGGGSLFGVLIAKALDYWMAVAKDKRDFKRYRREREYSEIEQLKDAVGNIYELSANWQAYQDKKEQYEKAFVNDYELIGKYNKFPEIAATARDAIHYCKIVAYAEKESLNDLIQTKKELAEKYDAFLKACDKFLDESRAYRLGWLRNRIKPRK
jgi:hypothetical protein